MGVILLIASPTILGTLAQSDAVSETGDLGVWTGGENLSSSVAYYSGVRISIDELVGSEGYELPPEIGGGKQIDVYVLRGSEFVITDFDAVQCGSAFSYDPSTRTATAIVTETSNGYYGDGPYAWVSIYAVDPPLYSKLVFESDPSEGTIQYIGS